MTKALAKKRKISKIPCRVCHHKTKHTVLFTHNTSDFAEGDAYGHVSWEDHYDVLECRGCESVTLRHTHWFSEDPEPDVKYYPPSVSRPKPSWRNSLKSLNLRFLVDEVYSALDNDCGRLATMGARTIVDMVLSDKVGDVGSFGKKLEKLERDGFVGKQNREFLEAALDTGNAAAHRGFEPKKEQLNHVMDIVENLLQAVYVLQGAAAELRKSTPPRRSRPL
jgi:hypothetical protein